MCTNSPIKNCCISKIQQQQSNSERLKIKGNANILGKCKPSHKRKIMTLISDKVEFGGKKH